MSNLDLFERAGEAAAAIVAAIPERPRIAVVLGSGLGALADRLADAVAIPYGQIPYFPRPSVAGHGGNLVAGTLAGARVLILQGRFHYYEGHDLDAVTFPVRVLQRLGVRDADPDRRHRGHQPGPPARATSSAWRTTST